MRVWTLILKRILQAVPVLLGVTVLTFAIAHSVPGDPARAQAGIYATEETIEAIRAKWGLDKPLVYQYGVYLNRLLHGDLGISIQSRRPVIDDISDRFPATIELALFALLLMVVIGIPLGIVAARWRNRLPDHVSRLFVIFGGAVPSFWLALVAQLVFFSWLEWLPFGGRSSAGIAVPDHVTGLYILDSIITWNGTALLDSLEHLLLPGMVLALAGTTSITRMTRASMLEVLSQDYIKAARAKGVSDLKVVLKHAFKNALIPTVTVLGLLFGSMLGGAFVVEWIFAWPGLGTLAANSITNLDYTVIMGISIVIAIVYTIANLLVDISYIVINPKVRYEK